ncbi:MAG: hypothetical protein LBS52_03030 [Dysgonamonadaceae bacterium]|nr:hypothetical protein [Dysgonamonadaceae bacterium]
MEYDQNVDLPKYSLEEILENHIAIAGKINDKIRPLPLFNTYLKQGYYPYYKESKKFYLSKLENTLNLTLETDLPFVERIEISSIRNIKKLLWIIAQSAPFTPNTTYLARNLDVGRVSILNFLTILERGGNYQSSAKSVKQHKGIGNLRETFCYNQLNVIGKVTSGGILDFKVDNKYTIEVGGKNKGHEQIMGIQNTYLALDNLEYGHHNEIPLWLLGFLY